MNRADEIRAHAQRIGAKPSNRSEAGQNERTQRSLHPKSRTKPIGKTVNLDPALNAAVQRWQSQAAADLGLSRVTFQETVDALLNVLISNNDLAADVRQHIASRAQI